MKRIGAIICLAALIITMTATTCFGAQGLKLVETYPKNGQENTTKENMCVKLYFNNKVTAEDTQKLNEDCFQITDKKGKKVPIRVFYNPKEPTQVMVLADTTKKLTIVDNADYTLTVSGKFADDKGSVLGEDQTITFKTLNQGGSTTIYMVMMGVMMVGMVFFTSRQVKKQRQGEQAEEAKREEPFNPYKEAKKTGKSIEDVTAIHEKEMARKAAKAARKAAHKSGNNDDDDDDDDDYDNHKVKGPRPVSAGGSTFITGRKAIAEAKIAEEERLAKRRAAAQKKKKK